MKKILVVSAHPDDEILGCGGAIAKHVEQGDEVHVCIVTKAHGESWAENHNKHKKLESESVDSCLDIKGRHYCDFPTMTLKNIPAMKLNSRIQSVVNKVEPDIVYTHFRHDVNEDHSEVFKSVLVCTRPISRSIEVRCFETLSSTEWGDKTFCPNFWVSLSKEHIEKKMKAFSCYKSEVKEYPHPRSLGGIKNLARKRGNEICKEYAECFMIIKSYWV